MAYPSVAQANSKTAEFARLFELFDRVATRRSQTLAVDTSEVISAEDVANVPAEFAPLLKNLSTILSLRARRDEEHAQRTKAVPTAKPCHDTFVDALSTTLTTENPTPRVDTMEPSDRGQDEEDIDRPTFPLDGERYPFTFKLMLHKLYDLDEWVEKVKNAVETSKSQFKPLAERVQDVVKDATTNSKERGVRSYIRPVLGASAKFKPPSTMRQAHAGAMSRDLTASIKERGERRSSVRSVLGTSAKFKPSITRQLHSVTTLSTKPEASRVLKKRCIGRRKSISSPTSTGVWVYDAAISATEVAGPRPVVEITLSAGGAAESRARHRSLTALEEMQTRGTARHKVKITVPLLQEKVAKSVPPQSLQASQGVAEMASVLKRRGSMASIFASGSCKRAAVKRSLCI